MAENARTAGHAAALNSEARAVGLLYLLFVLVGFFDLMYVPNALFVRGDAAATAHNITSHEMLFRWGMFSDIAGGFIGLLVALALYRLFVRVDRVQAGLLLILGGFMPVPLYFVNVVNYAAALQLIKGEGYLSAIGVTERNALARLFLDLHHYELLASFLFAGLWLIPFGILVYKSGFLPKTIGVWLLLNAIPYLGLCVAGFLAPQYADVIWNVSFPLTLGEIAITLWLLVMGARAGFKRP